MHEGTTELRVRYAETDQMGVVYHTNYLIWCEVGRTDLMRRLGATYAELERQGMFLTVAEARIRFVASARYDDRVRIRTTLTRVRSRGVDFNYVVENADTNEVLARAATSLICLRENGAPRSLPAGVNERLRGTLPRDLKKGTADALAVVDSSRRQ